MYTRAIFKFSKRTISPDFLWKHIRAEGLGLFLVKSMIWDI